MCGFVGFLGSIENKEIILDKMLEKIIHRGPDQADVFINEDIALGFRRLSIIDIANGNQPMFNEDGSLVLVFNGEIYNHKEIKLELIKKGHVFKTESDTEVLVHAYEEYKEKMLDKLRGMFAFVVYDIKNKVIFGARDHFGIKPFYYTEVKDGNSSSLLFGSEIKSFLSYPNFIKEVNKEALKPYLTFQYSVLNETFFKNVFKLPPAHYFLYKNGKMQIERYWDISFEEEDNSLENYISEIKKIMSNSVKAHRNSEVEVGSFLSGGIDSSYITTELMPSKTFSVGFNEEKFNEISLAKELSRYLNIDNVSKLVTAKECFDNLSLIQYHMDEPQSNPSSIPLYFLSKLAREHVTVILSGEGADEIFGGYEWYDETPIMKKYKKLPSILRRYISSVAMKMPYFKGQGMLIKGGGNVEEHFIGQAFIFDEKESEDILKKDYLKAPSIKEITSPIYDKVKNKDDLTKKQYLDLNLWLPGDILLKADKMSMAHSLELRVPFLDTKVMKVAQKVPSKFRINNENTKYVLRRAANDILPEEWSNRKKKGFPVPIRFWLQEEEYYKRVKKSFESDYASIFFDTSKILNLLEDHFNKKCNNARKIWTIYTFLIWYEKFFIEEI